MTNSKQFDPKKFIDRDFEQELFEDLLEFKDDARILAIKDEGGMGKSQLLLRLQYRCRTVKPRTPVSLIDLRQLPDNAPLALVQQMQKDLIAFSVEFPRFTYYENARKACDFATIRGAVDFRGANLQQADVKAAGVIVEKAKHVTVAPGPLELTPEQMATAREKSAQAFLDDLGHCCAGRPIVLMLDHYEDCYEEKLQELQAWLRDCLLEKCFFDLKGRPGQLLLVLAGRKIPAFELNWSADDCRSVVRSINALSKWQRSHVEECLRVHGFDYREQELDLFTLWIENGLPPSNAVEMIRMLIHSRQK